MEVALSVRRVVASASLRRTCSVDRVNHWAAITYAHVPGIQVAIMDWHSRYVLAWKLSNTLEADFCIDALKEALDSRRSSTPTRGASSPVKPSVACCWSSRSADGKGR